MGSNSINNDMHINQKGFVNIFIVIIIVVIGAVGYFILRTPAHVAVVQNQITSTIPTPKYSAVRKTGSVTDLGSWESLLQESPELVHDAPPLLYFDIFHKNQYTDPLPPEIVSHEKKMGTEILWSKNGKNFWLYLSVGVPINQDATGRSALFILPKDSHAPILLSEQYDYGPIYYSFSDDYVFFTKRIHGNNPQQVLTQSSEYFFEPSFYEVANKKITKVDLGISHPACFDFKSVPIYRDMIYFPTNIQSRDVGTACKHAKNSIISYDLHTGKLTEILQLNRYAFDLFIHDGELYFGKQEGAWLKTEAYKFTPPQY